MLIQRGQVISGFDAVELRRLMRSLQRDKMTAGAIGEELGMTRVKALDLIDRLEVEGLIERCESRDGSVRYLLDEEAVGDLVEIGVWTTTVAGNALGKARIGVPMKRAKGEQLLADTLSRVVAENADEEGLFWVDTVGLFGSLADPANDHVGDVDLRVGFSRRLDGDDFMEENRRLIDLALAEGRRFSTLLDELFFPENQFKQRIRGRSNRLDIQFDQSDAPRPLPDGVRPVEVYRRGGVRASEATPDGS
jgi:predicted nucleotidyltransferase